MDFIAEDFPEHFPLTIILMSYIILQQWDSCVGATLEVVEETQENTVSQYLLLQHFESQALEQHSDRFITNVCNSRIGDFTFH